MLVHVMEAVKNDGRALQYASEDLRKESARLADGSSGVIWRHNLLNARFGIWLVACVVQWDPLLATDVGATLSSSPKDTLNSCKWQGP